LPFQRGNHHLAGLNASIIIRHHAVDGPFNMGKVNNRYPADNCYEKNQPINMIEIFALSVFSIKNSSFGLKFTAIRNASSIKNRRRSGSYPKQTVRLFPQVLVLKTFRKKIEAIGHQNRYRQPAASLLKTFIHFNYIL
jgi:hypothetical protein